MIFSTLVVDAFHYLTNIYTRDYQKYFKNNTISGTTIDKKPQFYCCF